MIAPGTAMREGVDAIVQAPHRRADLHRRQRGPLVPLLRRAEARGRLHPGAAVPAGQDGRRDHPVVERHEDRLGQRPADARPHDPLAGDRHPPPHRRARLQADRRAASSPCLRHAASCRSTSTAPSTSSRTFPWCWPRPTRPWPPWTSTAPASTRSPPGSPRWSSRAA